MGLENITLSEKNQTEKDVYCMMYDVNYMWTLKIYKYMYIQNRNRLTDIENKLGETMEKGGKTS